MDLFPRNARNLQDDELIHLQEKFASLVDSTVDLVCMPGLVCGLDAAYSGDSGVAVAAVVRTQTGELLEQAESRMDHLLEYRPGLFGFREGPLLVKAASRLRSKPGIFLVEGHGLAHPRRFGLACHVGIALDKPTVGVARRLLYGSLEDSMIVDSDGTVLGQLVRVTGRKRPLYVSVGHKINLDSAVRIVRLSLRFFPPYPSPLRTAHQDSVRLRSRYFRG